MGEWTTAIVFGLVLLAFVLGVSSIIMGFLPQNESGDVAMRNKVEYGFFGAAGLVLSLLGTYALATI